MIDKNEKQREGEKKKGTKDEGTDSHIQNRRDNVACLNREWERTRTANTRCGKKRNSKAGKTGWKKKACMFAEHDARMRVTMTDMHGKKEVIDTMVKRHTSL